MSEGKNSENRKEDRRALIKSAIIATAIPFVLMFLLSLIEWPEPSYVIYMSQTVEAQETLNAMPSSTPTITPFRTPTSTESPEPEAEPPDEETETPTIEPTITETPLAQTATSTPEVVLTPNVTGTIQAAFGEIDQQFKNTLQSSIAFNKPQAMKRGEATVIELLLNPAVSVDAIATELVEHGDLATSTAEPNQLISPSGNPTDIETAVINITPRMKAVLIAHDPDAFTITALHDNNEQVIVSTESTIWRWSVTAKKEGSQRLELILYQLIKYDEQEFWHEVETYKADIVVDVTMADRIKSLDWQWYAGFALSVAGLGFGVYKWLDERKKKTGGPRAGSKPKKVTKRR